MTNNTPIRLPFPTNYTDDQRAAIAESVADIRPDPHGWMEYDRDGIFFERFGGQLFAIFGNHTAQEIWCHRINDDSGTVVEFLPAIVDGHAILESPEEGRSGVLHLMRFTTHPRRPHVVGKWACLFLARGWLRPDELILPSHEILDHITDEVRRGGTPLTGGRPGWA